MTTTNNMSGVAPGVSKPSARKLAAKSSNAHSYDESEKVQFREIQTIYGFRVKMTAAEAKRLGLMR